MSWFRPEYALSVGVAVALAMFFPVAKHLRGDQRKSYYTLQTITLLGAITGAKLSVLLGDYGWPFVPLTDWHVVLLSGRSVTRVGTRVPLRTSSGSRDSSTSF